MLIPKITKVNVYCDHRHNPFFIALDGRLDTANRGAYRPPVTLAEMNLDERTIVVASKDQMASSIGGETVILGLQEGRYYGVDAVGARIWQLLQTPTSVAAIRDAIVTEYDVAPERCEADLFALLHRMLAARLIEVRTDSAP